MSNIVWPLDLAPRAFSLELNVRPTLGAANLGGSESVTDPLDDYWSATLEIDSRSSTTAAKLEAYINFLQGGIHTAEFGHIVRPLPRGTLQRNVTLQQAAAKGSDRVVLSANTGETLLAGDMLAIGGLLLQCAEDCIAIDNLLTVILVNRLRKQLQASSSVTLVNPKILFRLTSFSGLSYSIGYSEAVTLSFEEDI